MLFRRLFAALALLCVIASPAFAQKTKLQLTTEIPLLCPPGQFSGLCTVPNANQISTDVINAIMPTAPVVSGNFACFNGTTGLLQDCGSSPSGFIVAPIPVRAGDLLRWTGSAWSTCAGNNSGTQFLQEDASGNCSWAAGTATVTYNQRVVSTTPITVGATDDQIIIEQTSATTINLPAASTRSPAARPLVIKDFAFNSAVFTITINPNGAETIDGKSTLTITFNGSSYTLVPITGVGWAII